MDCLKCRYAFNNYDRIPRILNCGHTYCEVKFYY